MAVLSLNHSQILGIGALSILEPPPAAATETLIRQDAY